MNPIRTYIRDHAWTYGPFIRWKFGRVLDFPRPDTDCHIVGFPRSANTYSRYLALGLFPNHRFSTHIHTVASIRCALKHSVPMVAIVRDPASCVISLSLKAHRTPEDRCYILQNLQDYLHYHTFLLTRCPEAEIVDFRELVKEPEGFLRKVAHVLGEEWKPEYAIRIREIEEGFRAREAKKDPMGSSLPNMDREKQKAQYRDVVNGVAEYKQAEACYQELIKISRSREVG
jgi:hypothetical protein